MRQDESLLELGIVSMPDGSVVAEVRMAGESELGLAHGLGHARPVPNPEIDESAKPDKRRMIRTSRIMSSLVTLKPDDFGMDLHANEDPGDDLLVQRRVTDDWPRPSTGPKV